MANPSWIASAGGTTRSATQILNSGSTTTYISFGNTILQGNTTAEARQQSPSLAGTYSKLWIDMSANARSTTTTIRFRVNAGNGNQVVSVAASTSGRLTDASNTDAVSAGDKVNLSHVTGAGGSDMTIKSMGVVFDPTSGGAATLLYHGNENENFNTTAYYYFGGGSNGTPASTESDTWRVAGHSGTLSRFHAQIRANTGTTAQTHTVRINGADGNQTFSVSIGTTGYFEDTTHTDTVAAGDKFDHKEVRTDTNSHRLQSGIWLQGGSTSFMAASGYSSNSNPANGVTWYTAPGGTQTSNTTESLAQFYTPFDVIAKGIWTNIATNNTSTAVLVKHRIGGVDGTLSASITGNTTGLFSDTTHTDTVSASNLINTSYAGSTGSNSRVSEFMMFDSSTGSTSSPGAGSLVFTGKAVTTSAVVTSAPGAGSLVFTGKAVTTSAVVTSAPGAGSLTFTSYAPSTAAAVSATAGAGSLTFSGKTPSMALLVSPGIDTLVFTGYPVEGFVPSTTRITQFGLSALGQPDVAVRASQFGLGTLAITCTRTRITQMGLLVLAKGGVPPVTPSPLLLQGSGRTKVVDQRIVNMYYEQTPDGPANDARFGRPGLIQAAQRGGGPVSAIFDWQGFLFTVSGNTVWRDNENIGTVLAGADTRFATSDTEIVIVTGGRAYYVTTTSVTPMSDIDMPDPVIDVILRTNGRFIYLSDTGRWYYSDVGDARTIDGLSFATADQAPDNLMAAINVNDSFVLFGTKSGEWWYDTGDNDAPFQRSQGRAYRKGLAARMTLVEADNTAYFLGSDRIVYRMGADPVRVSTFDVEDEIRRVPDVDLTKAWAFSTVFGGHTFYVLSLPGQSTWALDISQNKWQEWRSWNKPNFRVRTASGPYLGDQYTGNIMSFSQDVYTDLGDPLERIVGVYLPTKANAKNFNLILHTLRGVGKATGYGSQPVVEMRFSDGDGRVFGNWMEAPLGKVGDFGLTAISTWDQLGIVTPPGRVYEFRVTDPVEFTPYMVKYNETYPR